MKDKKIVKKLANIISKAHISNKEMPRIGLL